MRQQVLDLQSGDEQPGDVVGVRLARELHTHVGPAHVRQGHEAQGPRAQHTRSRAQPRRHPMPLGQLRPHRSLVVARSATMHIDHRRAHRGRLDALCQRGLQQNLLRRKRCPLFIQIVVVVIHSSEFIYCFKFI